MNLTITVTTVIGRPQISVSADTTPALISKAVANKYGYVAIGVPHSWFGVLSD